VIAVKLWDTEPPRARSRAFPGGRRSLQNGVDKDEVLVGALGRDRVLGGVTHIAAVISEPGVIAQTGKLQRVTLASLERVAHAAPPGHGGRIPFSGVAAVVQRRHPPGHLEKFVFLSALSGLTALTRKPIGGSARESGDAQLLLEALRRAVAVARAREPGWTCVRSKSSSRPWTRCPPECCPRWHRICCAPGVSSCLG